METFRVLAMVTPVSYQRIGGIVRFAKENGWLLTIHDRLYGHDPSAEYDGILVTLRQNWRDMGYVRRMRRRGKPVVDLTIERPRYALPRVISDHYDIGAVAAAHFRERGFTSTAWFSTAWTHVHALRFAGLADNSARRPACIVSADEGDIIRRLTALPRPLAALTYDESDAVRLLNICLRAKLSVPDDMAILSIGDDPLFTGNQEVPLSAVDLRPARAGYAAAALLHRLMMNGRPPSKPVLIRPGKVIVRRSTDTLASDDPLVRKALLYIRDNLSRPFGAEQIADALNVSRSVLDKACAVHLGRSLGKEIFSRRMDEARRLLEKGDGRIEEIAHATGFCSSAYFVKRFRDEFGTTPRRYKMSVEDAAHPMPTGNLV